MATTEDLPNGDEIRAVMSALGKRKSKKKAEAARRNIEKALAERRAFWGKKRKTA